MAKPYVVVVGNVCSGKTTFVNRFIAMYKQWNSLPENLAEGEWKRPVNVDDYTLTTFFMIYYASRHLQAQKIPGPLIQESCLETNILYPDAYYELDCISHDQFNLLKLGNSSFIKHLPRPDFYIYLSASLDVLLARAEKRKEPARSLSIKLIPIMQDRMERWIDHEVEPDRVFRIDTGSVDTIVEGSVFEEAFSHLEKL
jgi:deoxyadenosine/deoxycytidine kinase